MTTPHYVSTSYGQTRLWIDGEGPTLVVLAGLTRAARVELRDLREALGSWRIVAVEPPGVAGSARVSARSVDDCAAAVAEALAFLDGERYALVACDLSCALIPAVLELLEPVTSVLVGAQAALGWVDTQTMPPSLRPREDGSHLNALWSFLRDRSLLRPDVPTLPLTGGAPLAGVAELSASFLDAVTAPEKFADIWRLDSDALAGALEAIADLPRVAMISKVPGALGEPPTASAAMPPPAAAAPGTEVWYDYIETSAGRAHLRRAGSAGPPVLVLATGGGSSAQFAPVLSGLAQTRTAVAIDYFGNGLSDALDRVPTVATLAAEAFAVADALGWDTFQVWGSHTGACVALEMTIMAPERITKGVFEAPVMVTPEFRDDVLANYFPDFAPDKFGLHLQHVWNWRRDMFFYWPWYRVEQASARAIGIPTAEDLHLYCVGILESGTTYDGAYRAGFSYDTWSRLPELRRPAILTAGPHDMLANALEDAAALVPDALLQIVPTPTTVWWPDPEPAAAEQTLQIYRDFLE